MTITTDYRQTHFQIKNPTAITGEPTYESLKHLHNDLKVNAQTVPSTRGGGNHGHLGLVLSAVDYQLITLTPFILPINPGDFTLPLNVNLTMNQITVLKENHISQREQYEKVSAVEAALKQFLVEAIHSDYLLEIRNSTTQMLEGSIPIILEHLFAAYGNLTAKTFSSKQQDLTNFV